MANNILNELQERNKSLAEENEQLKARFGVNENNNLTPAEVRQEIIRALSEGHYTNTPDEKLLDDIMTYYPGQNWPKFCENFPVKGARQGHIILLYKFTMYYKDWFKHYDEIKQAKLNLFATLQGLNSKESRKVVAAYDEAREKGRNKFGAYGGLYHELHDTSLAEIIKSITEWMPMANKSFVEAKELAEQVKELEPFKEKVENLKKKTMELLSVWCKEEVEGETNGWDYWNVEELTGLMNKVNSELNETVIRIIEKWEQDAKSHSEAVDIAEEWKSWQQKLLNDEIKMQALTLQESDKMLEEERVRNMRLQEDLEEKSKILAESERREEELNRQLHLERKPLPALPREENENLVKQGIFKQLITKAKIKVQQLQRLIKREKLHNQEFVSRIEVSVK